VLAGRAALGSSGLPGDVVRAIEPHAESDPVAFLLNPWRALETPFDRGPYFQVEGDRHFTVLDLVLAGDTDFGLVSQLTTPPG
jgi:hypothetical protein